MRINDQIIKGAEIVIVSDKRLYGTNGAINVTVYEARVRKDNKKVIKKRSEKFSELQKWVLDQVAKAS